MTALADEASGVVEPVHWGSRLVRTPDVVYTEVAGVPCLVRVDGVVQALTPTWAAIWAQLDGRPVDEALDVDVSTLGPVDARNLIEVLRRLKGRGVVRDVDPADTPPPAADLSSSTVPGGSVKLTLHGTIDHGHDRTDFTIDPLAAECVEVTLVDGAEGVGVTIRRRLRKRRVGHIAVVDSTSTDDTPVAIGCFASIIRAVDDRTKLVTPGLVDLLAGLAERAASPVSPRH